MSGDETKGQVSCGCGNKLFKVYYDFKNEFIDCHCPICYTRIKLIGRSEMYHHED